MIKSLITIILYEKGISHPDYWEVRYATARSLGELAKKSPRKKQFSYMKNVKKLIVINEFLPNPIGKDNDLMPGGEWVELYNKGIKEILM